MIRIEAQGSFSVLPICLFFFFFPTLCVYLLYFPYTQVGTLLTQTKSTLKQLIGTEKVNMVPVDFFWGEWIMSRVDLSYWKGKFQFIIGLAIFVIKIVTHIEFI